MRLKACGHGPEKVKAVFITHWHADHHLGLPSILLCLGLHGRKRPGSVPLTIAGPSRHCRRTVRRAMGFLQYDLYPELRLDLTTVPLGRDGRYENEELLVETFPLPHTTTLAAAKEIPSLAYRFTEKSCLYSFVTAWDTAFCPRLAGFARNRRLLVHDAAHTLPAEAAKIAERAGVERLYLIHYEGDGRKALEEARKVFPETFLAREGQSVDLSDKDPGS